MWGLSGVTSLSREAKEMGSGGHRMLGSAG